MFEVLDSSAVITELVFVLQGVQECILKMHVQGLGKWPSRYEHLLHGCKDLSSNPWYLHEKLGVAEPVTPELGVGLRDRRISGVR